jgi:uncharacterized membrane protein YfcA
MTAAGWLVALSVGLLAGAISGLVGIGGGAVMVPFLYFFLAHPEISGSLIQQSDQAVVAHATSLLVIVPISIRGAWLYHREGLVEWNAVWRMGIASVLTAMLGARVAVLLPGEALKLAFGVFLVIIATRLAFAKKRDGDGPEEGAGISTGRALVGGAAVGFFSALLGVGGGLVAIPVLIYWLGVPIRKVTATSLALITFTAVMGVLSYAVSGAFTAPGSALTYFHLPAALALVLGAILAVPVGTRLQLSMPAHRLRPMFALVFFLLGLRIITLNLLDLLRSV